MRALLIILALLLAGCSDGPSQPTDGLEVTEDTGAIRGVVVDEALRPVEGAEVTLPEAATTLTDADGAFTFTGLAPGEYFVTARKAGYASGQTIATVVAGDPDPPAIRLLVTYLSDAQPAVQTVVLRGFYECAMGTEVVTDSCDWPYRTAHDTFTNATGQPVPAPRSIQSFHNTLEFDVPPGTQSIVQEAQWSDPQVSLMKISLDATPIDPICDCSNSFLEVDQPSPTYGRIDESAPEGQRVAARGFLPFGEPQVAVNFEFAVYTTVFVHMEAPEGWSFVAGDEPPV